MKHIGALLLVATFTASFPAAAPAIEFGSPADCFLGDDCFVQQFPDMEPGPDAIDPFCGAATYDDHSGLDLRVLSMPDIERGVPVIAMADGTVLRLRDGAKDRIASSEDEQAAVVGAECGNGVIVAHTEGYETQYCHLRKGSIAVTAGQNIEKGEKIGEIGASGMAQFPHVHVTVRKDGKEIDPSTGRALGAGCLSDPEVGEGLFSPDVAGEMGRGDTALLAFGLTGAIFDHHELVTKGPPARARVGSDVTLAWAWFINLRDDDRVHFRMMHPDGSVFIDETSDPVDAAKADYSHYAGRRRPVVPGTYGLTISLMRDGKTVMEKSGDFDVGE